MEKRESFMKQFFFFNEAKARTSMSSYDEGPLLENAKSDNFFFDIQTIIIKILYFPLLAI